MTKTKDYYETLGVSKDATKKDIREAYLKLAKKYHPDVNKEQDAERRFKEVQEAYEVLHDDEKRKEYDQFGESGYRYVGGGQYTDGGNFQGGAGDLNDFFSQWFGRGRGRTVFYEDDMFTGGARQSRVRADEEASLHITLEQALQGDQMQINVDGRTLKVKIPKSVVNGQKIRLKGQSSRKTPGGKRGDLYIVLLLKPHPKFKADRYDLSAILQIAPWHAALGTKAEIMTLDGTRLHVRIPSGVSAGQKIRLANHGLTKPNGQRGDLLLELEIVVPKAQSDRVRELYEQLDKAHAYEPAIK